MALNFQQVIMKLHEYWAEQGCLIWRPYNVQNGAGTGNPATLLRVLGKEPWRVGYIEPSVRPDDGRFGENPNRLQMHTQYQVILKPDPGNPQELYLQSLEALGIDPRQHDIRFVEDNWESPALGAWGLGWEVWLDGQEITQFTYFQQAGGMELDPVAVEITYGLERIVLALQNKSSVWEIDWLDGVSYGDVLLRPEIEHCMYYFDIADVDGLKATFDLYENEYKRALDANAVIPAYDYVLKCSHLFNVLDTRGAIGVTERASFFRRMRDMTRSIARAYVEQREEAEFPFTKMQHSWQAPALQEPTKMPPAPTEAADFLLEIGVEELPASDLDDVLEQLHTAAETLFTDLRLPYHSFSVLGTPRRLVLVARHVAPAQTDVEQIEKGPPADRAFDADGNPTKAAQGFARSRGVDVADLKVEEVDGGRYVTALVREEGRPVTEVLAEALPDVIAGLKFGKAMRWNQTNIAFSRPLRWLVAVFDDVVVPFTYAGVATGRVTRGLRPYGSPEAEIDNVQAYFDRMGEQNIVLGRDARRARVLEQITALADEVGGTIPDDPGLLDEVTNLVESPTALRGSFEDKYLKLPREVLVSVMRKHQRYFPIEDASGDLMPYFIAVRNGDAAHLDMVTDGNEQVLRARFSDADFFYNEDIKKPLEEHLPRLSTLTFQEKLGSMLDKNDRVAALVPDIGKLMSFEPDVIATAQAAGKIAKADLATQMVVEMTSLQGVMGQKYALLNGKPDTVADAVFEHWLPRSADDILPGSDAGALLALTDRLDSLVGLFGVGLAPKANADPYGLRRAALGLIEILVDRDLDVYLPEAIDRVAAAQPADVSQEAKDDLVNFIGGRLEVWLMDRGWSTDIVQSVLAEQATNPAHAMQGVRDLSEWVKRDNWTEVLDGFARCVRITRNENEAYPLSADLIEEDEEKVLFEAYGEASERLDAHDNVDAFLSAFEPMLPAISTFFDRVLVHAEDEAVRKNRLGLLQKISQLQHNRADLSYLSGF